MIEKLTDRIRSPVSPSLPEISCAASLAHHNLLNHVGGGHGGGLAWETLADVDLSSIPPDHLGSVMSFVGRWLTIRHVTGKGLVNILSNVNSCWLSIYNTTLGVEETEALVKRMEAPGDGFGLTLKMGVEVVIDIKTLTEYSGDGQCRDVRCSDDTATRYKEELRTWAESKQWEVVQCDSFECCGAIMISKTDI